MSLKLTNLTYQLPNSVSDQPQLILDQLDHTFADRQITAITGPNGSGKSTLAQIIMGISQPTTGQVWLDDQDITTWPIEKRAQAGLSLSFQQPVKFTGLSVRDFLQTAAGQPLSATQLCQILQLVDLEPATYLSRSVDKRLSGGELKRLEIASVILRPATVAIFDEPEAGIDLWSFSRLTELFAALKASQKTIIIITHQQKILELADEIMLLRVGKISTVGPRDQVLPTLNFGPRCHNCSLAEPTVTDSLTTLLNSLT